MDNSDTQPPPEYHEFAPQNPERTPPLNNEAFYETAPHIDIKQPYSPQAPREAPRPSTPRYWQSSGEEDLNEALEYGSEDEDPEVAFFMDLRMQEEERDRRRETRDMRPRNSAFELE
jgi:hypothetical protein